MNAARRLRIHGRVQGVSYRDWAIAAAQALGLAGWVRNRRDGSVELLAIGDAGSLDAIEAQCRQGPPLARVERIEARPADAEPLTGFVRRPTE